MAIHQFLIVYDASAQRLLEATDLGVDTGAAVAAYAEYEERYRGQGGIEVVLIGSDSIETIKQTHGHYFGRVDPSEFFEAVIA
ncbi:MAG TPA: hypothetical protein VMF55_16740 [Solirubrobacterales bacterium]|nr:hypothetical protein [Solirubrobacterales bacterium]